MLSRLMATEASLVGREVPLPVQRGLLVLLLLVVVVRERRHAASEWMGLTRMGLGERVKVLSPIGRFLVGVHAKSRGATVELVEKWVDQIASLGGRVVSRSEYSWSRCRG